MKALWSKYKHITLALVYLLIYLLWFAYVESTNTENYHLIYMKIDNCIPLVELFIIPYLLWFPYVAAGVLYLCFTNKNDYYKACAFLFTGMTIFLIISTVYPNGHGLRPDTFPRDNIFTSFIKGLYLADTPTNIVPSIHVFNSIGIHIAVAHNEVLRKIKWVHISSLILCTLITLSTVFIKQHSVFDMITAFIMAAVLYVLVYRVDYRRVLKRKA